MPGIEMSGFELHASPDTVVTTRYNVCTVSAIRS